MLFSFQSEPKEQKGVGKSGSVEKGTVKKTDLKSANTCQLYVKIKVDVKRINE